MIITLFVALILESTYPQSPCRAVDPHINQSYLGGCKNGVAFGYGSAAGKDRYEGQFIDGKKQGIGEYFWQNGATYAGEFHLDMPEGFGIYTSSAKIETDRQIVEGYFHQGKFLFNCRSAKECKSILKLRELDEQQDKESRRNYAENKACINALRDQGTDFYLLNDLGQREAYRIKEIHLLNQTVVIEKIMDTQLSFAQIHKTVGCLWLDDYLNSVR